MRNIDRAMPEFSFVGYHPFVSADGEEHGSFEVFFSLGGVMDGEVVEEGWYWWACHPGCLPDGEPVGPFPTDEGAYLDALDD